MSYLINFDISWDQDIRPAAIIDHLVQLPDSPQRPDIESGDPEYSHEIQLNNISRWPDYIDHLLALSGRFNDAIFRVMCQGEDDADRWIDYFHNEGLLTVTAFDGHTPPTKAEMNRRQRQPRPDSQLNQETQIRE